MFTHLTLSGRTIRRFLILVAAVCVHVAVLMLLTNSTPAKGDEALHDEHSAPSDHCVAMGPASVIKDVPTPSAPISNPSPNHLIHPCSGIYQEPPFSGLSPLSISWVPGMCTSDVYSAGYGDPAVWQANGHSYVAISGFGQRMYHIWNVDDPYNPVLLRSQTFPSGGTASTSIFAFQQNGNRYMSVTMRGSGSGCGLFIYNVDDPANPAFVSRKTGSDWCTVHEHFISTDASGNADFAWLTMSAESGSGIKIVAVDLSDIANPVETGRYQRPDAVGFSHDSSVVGDRVFLAHWNGGVVIFDKNTLAHNINPAPLNQIDALRPSGFQAHHVIPTSDGQHLIMEDEFINVAGSEKVKMYNISNLAAPYYETGIAGTGVTATNRAHNLKIIPQGNGHDLLLVGWYMAGTRGFDINLNGPTPVITEVFSHQLRQSTNGQFGDVWGVDYLPCTVRGQQRTCLYSADMFYGLVIDTIGYDPSLDPYLPEATITAPSNGETINGCSYTIQGNGHDYWSGLARVEVSTDDGKTWAVAEGTTNWSYQWSIPGNGSYNIRVRAVDLAGNVMDPSQPVSVNVVGCTTGTATAISTSSPVPATSTPVPPTDTTVPTDTATAVPPTNTEMPATSTSVAPTSTAEQPTNTSVASSTPTGTQVPASATSTSVPPTSCAIQFSDVPVGSTFYTYVHCLACTGIISGYPDGTFRLYSNITRGQIAKIVSNAAGYNDDVMGRQTYTDVAPAQPFWAWVERLTLHNVMSGYPCGGPTEQCDGQQRPYFRPSNNATRGQLAKTVAIAANYQEEPTGQIFEDVPPGHPFYVWIERLASRGIMSGYSCGGPGEQCVPPANRPYFRPGSDVTRGQASKIVSNTFFPGCSTGASARK